jgi:hypothetical protein
MLDTAIRAINVSLALSIAVFLLSFIVNKGAAPCVWWSQGGSGAGDPQLNILLSFLHGKTDNPIRFAAFKKCGEGPKLPVG